MSEQPKQMPENEAEQYRTTIEEVMLQHIKYISELSKKVFEMKSTEYNWQSEIIRANLEAIRQSQERIMSTYASNLIGTKFLEKIERKILG